MKSRSAILLAILLAVLAGSALWAFMQHGQARARATEAREALGDCQRMLMQIKSASGRPAMAAEREHDPAETTALIEQAAKSAKIAPSSLVNISPQQPQRVADSHYKEKSTGVQLENVSLQQIVCMLHALSTIDKPLVPKSIRIFAPRDPSNSSHWNADITVTYLIYDPLRKNQ